jgi:hypothetical protein
MGKRKITKSEVQAIIRIIVPGILLMLSSKVITSNFIHKLAFDIGNKYWKNLFENPEGLSYVVFIIGLLITAIGVLEVASGHYR